MTKPCYKKSDVANYSGAWLTKTRKCAAAIENTLLADDSKTKWLYQHKSEKKTLLGAYTHDMRDTIVAGGGTLWRISGVFMQSVSTEFFRSNFRESKPL